MTSQQIVRCATLATLAAAVASLTPVCAATAQMGRAGGGERHLIRVGFGGGTSIPTKQAADALKRGVNGQGFVLIDPGVIPPIRLNLGYQKFDFKEAVLGSATTTGDTEILSGVAGISINLFRIGPVRPYVTAGLGAFNVREALAAGAAGGEQSASETRFGVDGGAGLALKLGRLEAFIEGRVQNVYTERGAIDAKTIQAVPVTFGILF